MSNWKQHKLSDIADVKLSNVDKKIKKNERTIRLCNYTDVYKNSFINFEKAQNFMVATCNENEYEKFILRKGQVAITKDSETSDDIGVSTYISEDFQDVVLGYHLSIITPQKDKLNGRFLHYWLNTKQAKRYFENNAGGSGQRCSLPLNIIKSIPLYLPNLTTQKATAKILSDLDSKIELNNKINAELEKMAKTLYDYWFVQFDFPDKNGKPYKSTGGKMVYNEKLKREIPEGWGVTTFDKFADNLDSKRIPLSSQERLKKQGQYPYYGATGIMDYVSDYIFDGDYILLAEDGSVIDNKGFPIVQYIWGKTWVNNHAHVLSSKESENIHYLYYYLKSIPAIKIMSGSIQKKINQDNLNKVRVINPDKKILIAFSAVIKPIRNKIINFTEENQKLAELRDWLLPMLMNGQVEVV